MVEEYRRFDPAQHPCEADLPSGRREEILAANDEVDTLPVIIDRHCELVRPEAISIAQQQIAALRGRCLLARPQTRIDEPLDAGPHFHPHSAARPGGQRPRSASA